MDSNLFDYIYKARALGLKDLQIRENLLKVGWDPVQIDQVFLEIRKVQPPVVKVAPNSSVNVAGKKQSNKFLLGKVIFSVIILVILLGGGAYYAYGYINHNPDHIWKKFAASKKITIFKSTFELSISGQGLQNKFGSPEDGSLLIKGSSYFNLPNWPDLTASADLNLGFQSNKASDIRALKILFFDKLFFINVGSFPELSGIIGQKLDWLKLDFSKFEDFASTTPFSNQITQVKETQKTLGQSALNSLELNKVIKATKYIGTEKIGSVTTYHVQNTFNKEYLKNQLRVISQQFGKPDQAAAQKKSILLFNEYLDKIEISKFETWVGKDDGQLYKIAFEASLPETVASTNSATSNTAPDNVKLVITFSDYGKKQTLSQPVGAVDLVDLIKSVLEKIKNLGSSASGL